MDRATRRRSRPCYARIAGARRSSARRTRPCGAARAPRSTSTEDLWVYELTTPAGDPTPDTVYVAINRSDNDLHDDRAARRASPSSSRCTPEGASPVTIPARQTRIFE